MTFTLHMAWHMLLVTVAAPMAAAAIAGTQRDPVRAAPAAFSPVAACLLEFLIVWGWHLPALHVAARHQGIWFAAEQLSFAGAALFLWLSIIGGDPRERRARAGSGVIALVLTFAHMTMLGVLIALAPRELYGHGDLADQQLGGAVMVIAATVVFPAAAVWLLYPAIAARTAPESRS
jgi:putative membrane protein